MLSDLQKLLAAACHADDPWVKLQHALQDPALALAADERAALARIDPDALRMTGLIVKKLRAERLLRGDPSLQAAVDRDPAAFFAEYRRYAGAVAAHAWFPAEEAAAFRAWRAGPPVTGA